MNTIKITVDNRDFENVHIDTYGMLTGDSNEEMELENLAEEHGKDITYDDFDWTYNHPAIVEAFADNSINILKQAITYTPAEKVVTDIALVKSGSPEFYNYTTDWYTAEYTVDIAELLKYIDANREAVTKIASKYDDTLVDPDWEISEESMHHAAICHLINNLIEADDYNMSMWEVESEVYSDNTKVELIKK